MADEKLLRLMVFQALGGLCLTMALAASAAGQISSINVKSGAPIAIDGDPSDWRLWEFTSYSRGGQMEAGDIGLVGFLDGILYYGENYLSTGFELPTDAADHTAWMYVRHDADYQYFLFRLDDEEILTPTPIGDNYRNDCVEFFVDPANADSTIPMWNTTNDSVFELVIDAANQVNVYMTPSSYRTQLLAGVTSAVTTDATGWWLEVRLGKSATNPPLPADGIFGISIFYRDLDAQDIKTLYGWTSDFNGQTPFPSKIPVNWGDVVNPVSTILDCNANGTPDDQDISGGGVPDCNTNDIPDDCDISFGLSTDCDGNTVPDDCQLDTDLDTVIDVCDNCDNDPNLDQANNDGDALGDVCDPDDDNDTVLDGLDNCVFTANAGQEDEDQDRIGDACDLCLGTFPGVLVDDEGCPLPVPGDFDGDGDVDLGDFSQLQTCMTDGIPPSLPPGCVPTDLSGDGAVNAIDLTQFIGCMSGSRLPGDPACMN